MRKDFFLKDDSHPVALGVACHKLFGEDWLSWEPRTIYEELRDRGFGNISQHRSNTQKLQAFRTARNTIMPWMEWEVFEKVGHAFNGYVPNFDLIEPLSIGEVMITVDCLRACQVVPFADEVKRYIAACGENEELEFLPDPITFAMPLLCQPRYRCLDCGNDDYDDLDDGQCDVCVGRYEDGIPNGKPAEGLENHGKRIERYMPFDYAPIARLFNKASTLSLDTITLGESPVEIQVAKLLAFTSKRKDMQQQMALQLEEIKHG